MFMKFVPWIGVALLGLAGPSCQKKDDLTVSDSEGRSFAVRCGDGRPGCTLTQKSGPKAEAKRPTLASRGRVVGVCDSSDAGEAHAADCRPLLCKADDDCPPVNGPGTASCISGLCVDPAHSINSEDSVMLCLAGKGLGHEKREQVERYALAVNCGSPCVVPAPCRQP